MSHVHSLLAIYSALDQLVLETGDPRIERVVDRFLPGTAGNAGWSREIMRFLSDPDNPLPEFPSVTEAVNDIVDAERTSEESEPGTKPNPPTASELSRLTYVLGVLGRLEGGETEIDNDALLTGLSLVVPRGEREDETAYHLLQHFRTHFGERDDWPAVMRQAEAQGWIQPLIARIPVCHTRLKNAHGHLCVVLRTEFKSEDVSLDELRNVVDPLNWDECLPFFCEMQEIPKPQRADGWRRVLEVCNTTCPTPPDMRTPLKYWLGPSTSEAMQFDTPMAWVNYELDDTPGAAALGDGRVLVDEGYIKMYSTVGNATADGVRVVTKKVVCFRDLSEVAIAMLACVSGYGNQGMDMLLDGVAEQQKNPGRFKPWTPSALPGATGGTSSGAPTSPTDISVPSDPGRPSRRAITLAVEMANECIEDFSKRSTSVAAKMATGTMPISEMVALNTEFAVRLATDPWRYWDRLRQELGTGGAK
ncbi:hypothetical protein [Mycobacterium deserti]|uniref:Uncharacterized protein n=1 Tax=Mycobacterium deserti TaxID=2978347 RepID=A0ABT2M787_9MYCO|nr:hypothetical protein [Mycobacterium deserti]MCT7658124.1 hypothetical protein [Mycobacterium deserti]